MGVTLEGLEIRQGDFVLRADVAFAADCTTAIIGPSGAGKSTLLMAIAGFAPGVQGRVVIDGQDQRGVAPAQRPVSMMFQENNLFPHLDVFSNVGLGVRPDLKLDVSQRAQVGGALEKVGLGGRGGDYPGTLSGGERQRVALARAMLRDRPVWLLDEPFTALGPALRHEMLDLFESVRAAQSATLLLVSHNPDDARQIAQQTALVAEGRVFAPVETAALLDDPPPALAAYLG